MQIKGNKKVELQGRGPLVITANDHVATGGEGSIYRPSGSRTIIKLYTDTQKMRRDGMPEKISLLSKMQHPYIIAPIGLVLDGANPIGYFMSFAKGEPLSRVFTTSWRERESFEDKDALVLIDRMQQTVKEAHKHHAVMVDANELNWIVVSGKQKEPEPRVLDVDSWAIGRWPATVIMPSIRDWHAKRFDEKSDWFAYGIVSFQVLTGIHPYKGKLDGYKLGELERRMKENASVFTSGVQLNNAVRDFSCIPGPLLDWYIATFQQGMRSIPPSPFDTGLALAKVARIARAVVTAVGSLHYEKLWSDTSDSVVRIFPCGVVLTKSGKLIDLASLKKIGTAKSHECEVVENSGYWLKADKDGDTLLFSSINMSSLKEEALSFCLKGSDVFRYENRIFVKGDQGLTEVSLKIFGKTILAPGQTWGVMMNSTKWFDGVGIQDAMGATYVVAPFGDRSCALIRVRELDGLRPVMAKAGNRYVVIMTVDKKGQYQKVELTFDREYKTYQVWKNGSDSPDINMAILPKGVAAIIVEDGELNIFVPTSGQLRKIPDKQISTQMTLANWNDRVVYISKGAVWSMKVK